MLDARPFARHSVLTAALLLAAIALPASLSAADDSFTRLSDVIYGRKFGMALTMDVFEPRENATARPSFGPSVAAGSRATIASI